MSQVWGTVSERARLPTAAGGSLTHAEPGRQRINFRGKNGTGFHGQTVLRATSDQAIDTVRGTA